MKKRGSKQKNKFQRRNYLVLVIVFSIALVVLFSYGIFQNGSSITGLSVGDTLESKSLFQQLADKTMEEQELYSKMAQNTAERQKILTQIAKQQDNVVVTLPKEECTDSDIGKDYFKSGIVKITKAGLESPDVCYNKDEPVGSILIENFCKKDQNLGTEYIICKGSCSNGMCDASTKTAKCTETDKGKDQFVKGITKYDSDKELMTDYCRKITAGQKTTWTVMEYYCEDGVIKGENIACPENTCSDGACVKK